MKIGFLSALVCLGFLSLSVYGQSVQLWHPTDISFTSTSTAANKFQDASMTATLIGPGNVTLTIPAFHNGGNSWIVRFAPTKIGTWTYTTTSTTTSDLNSKTGTINCVANTLTTVHGKLGVDPVNRHHFRYEDGTPYFLLAGEIDWLGLMDFTDANILKEKQIIDMYTSNGFNQIFMDLFASNPTWNEAGHGEGTAYDFGPPAQWPFAGTNASPDHTKMNPAFFNHFDKVIDYLFQKGVVAHLYFKVYTKQVNYPANSSANDLMFWNYITARYQAYPNIMWDFAKESHTMTNNNNQYKKNMINLVKNVDAYDRLITTHDDDNFYSDASCRATIDFQADQYHTYQGSLYNMIVTQRNISWPIINAEYGYQWGPTGSSDLVYTPNPTSQACNAEEMLKRTYELTMAGGYACYYYTYHAWDIVKYDQTPSNFAYYKYLAGFFTRANWWALLPTDNLLSTTSGNHCLAKAGSEYIVYLSNGGTTNLTVASATGQLTATWMNAYTGVEQTGTSASNGTYAVASPWTNAPAVLWLRSGTGVTLHASMNGTRTKATGRTALYSINGKCLSAGGKSLLGSRATTNVPQGVYLIAREGQLVKSVQSLSITQ